MSTLIQFRRDTQANWANINPILAEGELGLVTDTGSYKIGNGALTWNALSYFELAPAVQALTFTSQADPSPPAPGNMVMYARRVSGRVLLKIVGPSGLNSPLQPAIFQNSLWLVQPNTTSSVSMVGGAATTTGTISTPTPSASSFGVCSNFASANTVGSATGAGQAVAPLNTSAGVAQNGGFFFVTRLWFPDANYGTGATGSRIFVGITSNTMAVSAASDNPAGSRIGFMISTVLGETNWMLTTKDGTTETRVDTGMPFAVNKLYDFYLFTPPSSSDLSWRIDNLSDDTTFEGMTVSTLPPSAVYMRGGFQLATLTTVARNVRMKKIYIETDN